MVAAALAAIAVRNGRSIAEAMALDMLLLLGLSPTVSDQYLMWAFPFLLVAGRLRTASLLSLGLLPAVVSLDLWTSQGDGATPRALLLLATASLLLGAGRWYLFLRAAGVERAPSSVLRAYLIGAFTTNFLPSQVGGDVTRAWLVGIAAAVNNW